MNAFEDRLEHVRQRVRAACGRAGRDPAGVMILPVTKTHGPERVREAAQCGLSAFGENRVQEAKQKIPRCPGHLAWHLVGHLQRNKVRDAVQLFEVIHSVDSVRLLQTVDAAAQSAGRVVPVYVEVNVSGEASKFGLPPDQLAGLLEAANALLHVEPVGLMTVPPLAKDPERARPFFRQLAQLRAQLREQTGFALPGLSMGMSNDFEVAVEEGATCVRLGSVLFGEREKGGQNRHPGGT
ncbi:MAG: YggS family pyridoxal phosphate-dependent enzyme [Kiritimatiellae bacterium]|nr:YggS family pyridoxal phosphate-dependent enzyme [Kiritimatiellia bacterium]